VQSYERIDFISTAPAEIMSKFKTNDLLFLHQNHKPLRSPINLYSSSSSDKARETKQTNENRRYKKNTKEGG